MKNEDVCAHTLFPYCHDSLTKPLRDGETGVGTQNVYLYFAVANESCRGESDIVSYSKFP